MTLVFGESSIPAEFGLGLALQDNDKKALISSFRWTLRITGGKHIGCIT